VLICSSQLLCNVTVELSLLNEKILFSVVKVKVKFPLEQLMKAQRGSGGIALLFL
jgi:hypothetical protein